jgi:hypothetical protein
VFNREPDLGGYHPQFSIDGQKRFFDTWCPFFAVKRVFLISFESIDGMARRISERDGWTTVQIVCQFSVLPVPHI